MAVTKMWANVSRVGECLQRRADVFVDKGCMELGASGFGRSSCFAEQRLGSRNSRAAGSARTIPRFRFCRHYAGDMEEEEGST